MAGRRMGAAAAIFDADGNVLLVHHAYGRSTPRAKVVMAPAKPVPDFRALPAAVDGDRHLVEEDLVGRIG
jgi:hypothetical protein